MSESQRLLICTFDVVPGPSGATRRLSETLQALSSHFEPEVLAVKGPDQPHLERLEGARLLRVPVGQGGLQARAESFERAVRRQLESDDYAAVHFSDPFGGYVLCEARASRGYKLVYEALRFPSHELRDRAPEVEGDRKFLSRVRRRELFCLMNADRVITGSHVTRNFVQSLGVSAEQISVLPTPIDVAGTTASPVVQREALRCLYIGGPARWQGLETLFRGIALAAAEVELELHLAGVSKPGPSEPLAALVEDLGIGGMLQFHGQVQSHAIAQLVADADVALLPLADCERNRLQGGPLDRLAPLLAGGRPVIASDLPLTRERLPGGCALFHPPGDAAALCSALLELARNPRKREEMGRRARTEAQRSLDRLPYRTRLLRLYGELLGRGARGSGGGGGGDNGSGSSPTDPLADAPQEEQTDSGFVGPAIEEFEVRPQVVPRSRLRSASVESKQVTRVARIADLNRPPAIPALSQEELSPPPQGLIRETPRPPPTGPLRNGRDKGAGSALLQRVTPALDEVARGGNVPTSAEDALGSTLPPPTGHFQNGVQPPDTDERIGSALPPPSELKRAHRPATHSIEARHPKAEVPAEPNRPLSGAFPRIGGGTSKAVAAVPRGGPDTSGPSAQAKAALTERPPAPRPRAPERASPGTDPPTEDDPRAKERARASEPPPRQRTSETPPRLPTTSRAAAPKPGSAIAGPPPLPPSDPTSPGRSGAFPALSPSGAAADPRTPPQLPRSTDAGTAPRRSGAFPALSPSGAAAEPHTPPQLPRSTDATVPRRSGAFPAIASPGTPADPRTPPQLPRNADASTAPRRSGAFPAVPPPLPTAPGQSRPRREALPPELPAADASPRIAGGPDREATAAAPETPHASAPPDDEEIPEVNEVSEVSGPLETALPEPAPAREAPTEAVQLPEDFLLPTDPGFRPADHLENGACFLPGQKDPWLLQVLQGYCPPGNAKSFARHAPPTTFPGRAGSAPRSSTGQKVG